MNFNARGFPIPGGSFFLVSVLFKLKTNRYSMAKDPAFLFYPGDWQLGTMHMTLLEKGCYMELLVLQFAKGQFTEAQAKHLLNGSFDLAWPTLREKFDTDGTFFWNKRLRLEKERRQKFTDSRKSNGSIKKQDKHLPKLMEDENVNKDGDENVAVFKGVRGETWDAIKLKWKSDWRWVDKFAMDGKHDRLYVLKRMDEFLADLEMKEDFKDVPGLKKHFFHWHKKHHNGSAKNIGNSATGNAGAKLGTSDARTEALRKW